MSECLNSQQIVTSQCVTFSEFRKKVSRGQMLPSMKKLHFSPETIPHVSRYFVVEVINLQ